MSHHLRILHLLNKSTIKPSVTQEDDNYLRSSDFVLLTRIIAKMIIIIPLCVCFLSKNNHNNSNKYLWKNASFHLVNKTIKCLIVLRRKAPNLPLSQRCLSGNEGHCSYPNRRRWSSKKACLQETNHLSKQILSSKNCRIRKINSKRIISWHVLLLLLYSLQTSTIIHFNSLRSSFLAISPAATASRLKYPK